ncbi:hypothetical protein [Gordonia sp. DT219]|uniref:hypothetical protein n=1 Tax=Gordonia sp. DT219 TaxID=3416658 RepID=UPI003CEF1A1A
MRIEWNRNGLYELRSDPALVAMEEAEAQKVADRANSMGKGTFAVGSRQGMKRPQGRWRTTVVTADAKAMASNAKHNILVRAMGGA